MRRFLTVLTWAVVTVVVCVLAWTAVRRVAADVSDHPTVVGNGAIREELGPDAGASGPGGAGTVPATNPDGTPVVTGAGPDGGTGTGTGTGAGGATSSGSPGGNAGAGGTGGSGSTAGRTGAGSSRGTPTTTTPAAPPTTTTTVPPPPPAGGPESSVITTGGSVTAACSGAAPRLVRAIPNAGYGVSVGGAGGQLVVSLRSSSHLSVVEIECEGARVQFSTSEESTG